MLLIRHMLGLDIVEGIKQNRDPFHVIDTGQLCYSSGEHIPGQVFRIGHQNSDTVQKFREIDSQI
ncbi:hypothetical protein ES703_70235 [subsurface metagenome]